MAYELNQLCETANVKQSEKTVLSKLCDRASEKNNYTCWPSVKLIADNIGRSPRTVKKSNQITGFKGLYFYRKKILV